MSDKKKVSDIRAKNDQLKTILDKLSTDDKAMPETLLSRLKGIVETIKLKLKGK